MPRPLLIDIGCGRGGVTKGFLSEGWRVLGIDLVRHPKYPGEFLRADIRDLKGCFFPGAFLLWVSMPCDEFSRWDMPWTRRRNPPLPDLSLVGAGFRVAGEAQCPLIMENVRGAQQFIGPAVAHCGPFYFWGDGVPALLPQRFSRKHKELLSGSAKAERAEVPFELSAYFARCWMNAWKKRLAA